MCICNLFYTERGCGGDFDKTEKTYPKTCLFKTFRILSSESHQKVFTLSKPFCRSVILPSLPERFAFVHEKKGRQYAGRVYPE